MELLQGVDIQAQIMAALITSIIVSAINTLKPALSTNWLVFIVAAIVSLLLTSFDAGSFPEVQKLIITILLTMAFSVMFYNYVGQHTVDRLFARVKRWIDNRFGGDGPSAT